FQGRAPRCRRLRRLPGVVGREPIPRRPARRDPAAARLPVANPVTRGGDGGGAGDALHGHEGEPRSLRGWAVRATTWLPPRARGAPRGPIGAHHGNTAVD